jgi:arabinofuranosyltransferase
VRWRRLIQPEILLFTLALAARLIPGPRTVDDAYITFRYAQNLLAGNGLVYNPGEAVLGTTTPVYALLMAGLGLITGGSHAPFPLLALIVNALSDAITCWLLARLGETLGYRHAGLATAAVWAIAPWSVTFAIGGMETSLFVLLTTATFYFYSKDKPVAAAMSGALSLLTRPDAILFILPITIERLRRSLRSKRLNPVPLRISTRELLTFGIPILGWVIIGTSLFGNPIPHSILAKVSAYRLPPEAGLVRLLQHYSTPFLGHLTFGLWWIGVGLVLFPTLFGLGALLILRKKPGTWAILVYPWIYLLAFAVANPLIFRWYLTPPLPIYFLGIFLGIERLTRDLRFRRLTILFPVIVFGFTLNGWTLHPDHGPNRPAPEMAYIELELLYQQIGTDLRDQIQPSQILAAGDIGALGYFTDAHILDTIGLISTQSLKYYPQPASNYAPGQNYAIPPRLILDLEPDFVVILEAYGRNALLLEEDFRQTYILLKTLQTDIYGSDGMLIFKRVLTP